MTFTSSDIVNEFSIEVPLRFHPFNVYSLKKGLTKALAFRQSLYVKLMEGEYGSGKAKADQPFYLATGSGALESRNSNRSAQSTKVASPSPCLVTISRGIDLF